MESFQKSFWANDWTITPDHLPSCRANTWNISLETLYDGQFTLLTQFIKPNYLVNNKLYIIYGYVPMHRNYLFISSYHVKNMLCVWKWCKGTHEFSKQAWTGWKWDISCNRSDTTTELQHVFCVSVFLISYFFLLKLFALPWQNFWTMPINKPDYWGQQQLLKVSLELLMSTKLVDYMHTANQSF